MSGRDEDSSSSFNGMNVTNVHGKAEMSRFTVSQDEDSSSSSNSTEYSNGLIKKVPLDRYHLYYLLLLTKIDILGSDEMLKLSIYVEHAIWLYG